MFRVCVVKRNSASALAVTQFTDSDFTSFAPYLQAVFSKKAYMRLPLNKIRPPQAARQNLCCGSLHLARRHLWRSPLILHPSSLTLPPSPFILQTPDSRLRFSVLSPQHSVLSLTLRRVGICAASRSVWVEWGAGAVALGTGNGCCWRLSLYASASIRLMAPFPAPPHQTVRAVFPHTAFGVPALSQACAGVPRLACSRR